MPDHQREKVPTGRHRPGRFGWMHRAGPTPAAPVPSAARHGDRVVIVQSGDFVSCTYHGCGTLRPLVEAAERRPCRGCGRV